jgi:hypothetical protein
MSYHDSISCKKLLQKKIESKRQEMIDKGTRFGLADERTVKVSKELDYLLNYMYNYSP